MSFAIVMAFTGFIAIKRSNEPCSESAASLNFGCI
jgi:hypothetical protein